MSILTKILAVVTALSTLNAASAKDLADAVKQLPEPTAPAYEEMTAAEFCKGIDVGWNLGNALDATGGSGLSTETSWGNPKTTKELILAVKDAGFNAVRVPTTWYKHVSGNNYAIDEEWLDRVQEVVDYAYGEDMYVILNAHHEDFNDPYNDTYKAASKELCAIWKQVAERFKGYDARLIFEGMNEPRKRGTNVEWNGGDAEGREVVNRLNADFVKTVRAAGGNNKTRFLMVPTYAASASGLDGFELPDDERLIVSIHAYTPYNFAMQTPGTTSFSADDDNSTRELKWLSQTLCDRFVSRGYGVIIGECGATNKDNSADRKRWAEYFPAVFGQYGIPVFLWDNNGYGTGSEKYGLIHRDTLTWEYPEYIKTFVKSAVKAMNG